MNSIDGQFLSALQRAGLAEETMASVVQDPGLASSLAKHANALCATCPAPARDKGATPDGLLSQLSLVERMSLRAFDMEVLQAGAQQTYLYSLGLEYVGELTRIRFPKRRRKFGSQVAIEDLLNFLDLDFGLDLDQAGWLPPYAKDKAVQAAWAMPLSQMFGEGIPWPWLRKRCEKKGVSWVWELLTDEFLAGRPGYLREVMFVLSHCHHSGILFGGMYVPPQFRVKET